MIKMIAECCSNHNNNWNRCEKLIKKAKDVGFGSVKFQLFKANKLVADKETQKKYKSQELNIKWLPKISKLCKELGLKFGLSVFYPEAIDEAKEYVDFFKISSFDILRLDLIRKCIETKKDVYISCGLATNENIENAIDLILQYGTPTNSYYFLHCISKYPAKIEEACLKRIRELYLILLKYKRKFMFVGYSDHTKDIDVVKQAISEYAQAIELHFDLEDETGSESQYGHCWTPLDINDLIASFEKINTILNGQFKLTNEQLNFRACTKTGLRGG